MKEGDVTVEWLIQHECVSCMGGLDDTFDIARWVSSNQEKLDHWTTYEAI